MTLLKKTLLAFVLLLTFTSCSKDEKEDETTKLDQITIEKLVGEWEIVGYIGTSAQKIDLSTLEFGKYTQCSNNLTTEIKFNADFKSKYYQISYGTGAVCTLDAPIEGKWAYSNGQFSESTFFSPQSATATILEITSTTLIIQSKLNESGFNRIFKLRKK